MNNIPPRLKCKFVYERDILSRDVLLNLSAWVDEYSLQKYLEARFGYTSDFQLDLAVDNQWGLGYMVLKALVEAEKDSLNLEDPPDYKVISVTRTSELSDLRARAEDIAGFQLSSTVSDYEALHGYLNYLESRVNKLEGRETALAGG